MSKKAVCTLVSKDGHAGTIHFVQDGDKVTVTGTVKGLTDGEHGFHIHKLGDTTNGCASTGGHFNPAGCNHGAPTDAVRHAGDLGNVKSAGGECKVEIVDKAANIGVDLICGRAVVVHEGVDDLGKGGHEQSLTTGNAGGRFCCGVIGLAE